MDNKKTSFCCIYCKHFNFSPGKEQPNAFKKELCLLKNEMHSPADEGCNFFEILSGVYLKSNH